MKKGIIFIILIVFIGFIAEFNGIKEVKSESAYQIIPDEAIRLRILANSDSEQDQHIKRLVRDDVNDYITKLVKEIDNIEEARELISKNVPKINSIVQDTLNQLEVNDSFTVEYSSNVTFPMKVYGQYVYPAGEYEAVLISIGEGRGSNWWCVLFPPLCFLDFSNGTTVAQSTEEIDNPLSESEDNLKEIETELEEIETEFEEDTDEEEVEVKFFLFEWLGLS